MGQIRRYIFGTHRHAGARLASLLSAALLVSAPLARAGAQTCPRAAVIRLGPNGFSFVVEQLRALLPDSFDLPRTSSVVMDWPLTADDARIDIEPVPGAVALRGMDLVMLDGGVLRLRALLDVDISAPATVHNAYVGYGTERCQVHLAISDLEFNADFQLQTAGTHVRVELTQTSATSNLSRRVVQLSGCTAGDIYTQLSEALGTQTEIGTQQWLEDFARQRVPPLIETALTQSLEGTLDGRPLSYRANLSQAASDAYGLLLTTDVEVDPVDQGFARCVAPVAPPLAPSCDQPAPAPAPSRTMYGVSFSQGLINRALHATWRAGLMCIDSGNLNLPELAVNIDKLAAMLGLPAGSQANFTIGMDKPPFVSLTQRDGARLSVEGLSLQLQLVISDGRSGSINLKSNFSVAAVPRIDPATNSLGLQLGEVGVSKLELGHQGQAHASLQIDPARLQRFIGEVAVPLLQRRLEQSQLSPSVLQAEAYFVIVQDLFVGDGYVTLQIDAHRPDFTRASGPPQTQLLESPGSVVSPQILQLKVTGLDDATPAPLLRFQARVDDGVWSEPRFGGLVDIVPHEGRLQVAVAAVDLAGNVDPSPIILAFDVDAVPPQIQITHRPDELIKDNAIEVGFTASDDRTAPQSIGFVFELFRITDDGGSLELIERQQLAPGATRTRSRARGSGLYRIRITAQDEAGNVTSADVGVVVERSGCNTSGGRPSPAWLLALLILFRRPRRLRRCAS